MPSCPAPSAAAAGVCGRPTHGPGRLLAAACLAILGALSGCSSGAATAPRSTVPTETSSAAVPSRAPTATTTAEVTAQATAAGSSPTGIPTSTATITGPAATSLPTATASAVALTGPLPTEFVAISKVIKDDSLGHEISVLRMARALPWPSGSAAQAAAFELIAIEMTWKAGTKYTAPLREVDFSLVTGSQYPNRADPLVDAQLATAGWALLPAEVPATQSATGWVVFKVDPKGAASIRLDYTRPEIVVTGTKTKFAKKVFSLQIVG